MGPERSTGSSLAAVYQYSGLGCLFAAAVLLFMAGGWYLDSLLGVFPLFLVLGALVGAALATLSIYRRLEEMRRKDDDSP